MAFSKSGSQAHNSNDETYIKEENGFYTHENLSAIRLNILMYWNAMLVLSELFSLYNYQSPEFMEAYAVKQESSRKKKLNNISLASMY